MVEVMPRCVPGMLGGVNAVGLGEVGVVRGLQVIAGIVVLCRFGVMVSGHSVMVGRGAMFVRCLL
jgi:hypothetical protein